MSLNPTNTITDRLDRANFSANTYSAIYASSNTDVIINSGQTMTLLAGVKLDVGVRSLSASSQTTVFVMGNPKPYNSVRPFDLNTGMASDDIVPY